MPEVKDPALLAILNGEAGPKPVTDPALLAQLNGEAPPASDPGVMATMGRYAGLAGRAVMQAPVSTVLGLPALVGDSFKGVGRDIAYGSKLALSKTGAVDAPDPKNYYAENNFPLSTMASEAAAAAPDAVGLPRPKTTWEKMAVASGEGVLSALSGVGLGNALSRFGGMAGSVGGFMAAEPKMQAAAGALGGSAAEFASNELGTVTEGSMTVGALAGAAPLLARKGWQGVTRSNLGSQDGLDRIAGQVAREAASDPAAAIRNLETAGSEIPGLRQFSTNAAQNYGLAFNNQKLRDWAGGENAALEAGNNRIISGWMDRFSGADTGGAATTRRAANAAVQPELDAMGLRTADPVDITSLMRDLRREGVTRSRPSSQQTEISAAREIRRDIETRATRTVDPDTNVVSWSIPAEALYSQRKDITGAARPSANPDARLPNVQRAGAYTRGVINRIDDIIDSVIGGGFGDYLTRQRSTRNVADRQEFISDLAGRKSLSSVAPDGSVQINKGGFLSALKDVNADRPVGGSGRTTTLNRVREIDPMAGTFLDALGRDLNRASFVDSPGLKSRGSSPSRNLDIAGNVDTTVKANRSVGDRIVGPVASFLATKLGFPGVAAGATNSGVQNLVAGRVGAAGDRVRARLGAAEVNPAEMARLMRLEPTAQRTLLGSTARGVAEFAKGGAPGFMAGFRSDERKRERRGRYR